MTGVNKVILVGHLGAAPEIKRSQDGKALATFSLATSEAWRDKATGERRERTEWHKIVIYNEALVKVAEQYLKKGSKVYLEGSNRTRKWTDSKGVDRFITEIILGPFHSNLTMLDKAERAPDASEESYSGAEGAKAPSPPIDDEIPF